MGLDHAIGIRNKGNVEDYEFLAVFRKFNALQGFMEENYNVENCEYTVIPKDCINELHSISSEILLSKTEEISERLLPTCNGFFYGSTSYDEYYYQDVELLRTVTNELINKCDNDKNIEIIYWCWW